MLPRTASTQVPSSPEESQQIWTLAGRQLSKEDCFKYGWNLRIEKFARKALEVKWQDMRDTAAGGYERLSRLVKKGWVVIATMNFIFCVLIFIPLSLCPRVTLTSVCMCTCTRVGNFLTAIRHWEKITESLRNLRHGWHYTIVITVYLQTLVWK